MRIDNRDNLCCAHAFTQLLQGAEVRLLAATLAALSG
jgi:hypothetical protein